MSKSAVFYGLAQSRLLAEVMSRKQLPGLSSLDQLYLLALSDTIASNKFDLEGDNDQQERGLQHARRETQTGKMQLQCLRWISQTTICLLHWYFHSC